MTSMTVVVANAERIANDVLAEVLTPPPPVNYLAWAERNIVFSERESPLPGPYNRDLFFYFDEILRALSPSDPCRTVTLAKSAQLGGTEARFLLADAGSPTLIQDAADEHTLYVLMPMRV